VRVITWDPGKRTGYSIWEDGKAIDAGAIEDYGQLINIMNQSRARVCVYEGFARANASTGDQLQAIEMCGAIQVLARLHGMKLLKQYPAQRKGYISFAKKLRVLEGIGKDYRVHAIDALAHGIRYHDKEEVEWRKQNSI
jgi:hypothetical protein